MLNVLRQPSYFCPGFVWHENLLQKVTASSCLKRTDSIEMIQTMSSSRSDIFRSSPHHRLPLPPLPLPPMATHRDAYPHIPSSTSSSSERSHYAVLGSMSYSQNQPRSLDTDFKTRDFDFKSRDFDFKSRDTDFKSRDFDFKSRDLCPLRQKDQGEDPSGLETSKPMRFGEQVSSKDTLDETISTSRTVSNSFGSQRHQSQTPQQQRHDMLWVRTGSDLGGVTNRYDDDVDEDDVDFVSPPKIAPVSGRIPTAADHPLVRPIPYKPIVAPTAACYETLRQKDASQNSSLDRQQSLSVAKLPSHSTDEGYASRDWQNLSSSSSVSQNSFHAAELGCNSERKSVKNRTMTPCGSNESNSFRQRFDSDHATGRRSSERSCERTSERNAASWGSRRRGVSFTQTPSPSDSGVGELEAMLREKDMELQMVRDTMERNELAMMQVFEEKQQTWQMEMGDVIQDWQLKLRGHQQKAFRTEQSLLLQVFKLQQDNKNLRQSLDRADGQTLGSVEEDLKTVQVRLEELVWEQRRACGEIETLRSQLKSAVEEASTKSMELISAQLLLKDGEIEIDCKNVEIHRLLVDLNQMKRELSEINEQRLGLECRLKKFESSSVDCGSTMDGLNASEMLRVELSVAHRELEGLRAALERERNQWIEEKTKVINYQKHLQLNYVQMARKNKMLETEVQQMSAELERHDADCQRATMDESFC